MASPPSTTTSAPTTRYELIALAKIDDPGRPMRTDLSRESVEELAKSIKQVGIIEPIVVRQRGDRFEVIAGHRRLVAAEVADLALIPCQIVTASDEQAEMMKIHENLYRLDVAPAQEAEHYDYLIKQLKLSPTRIAKLINKSESYVADRLNILNYAPALRECLDLGQINFTVAKEFNRLEDPTKLQQYLRYAMANGLTGRGAKQWVDEYYASKKPRQMAAVVAGGELPEQSIPDQLSRCVFCNNEIKLSEANVVYIHDSCLNETNRLHEAPIDPAPADPQRPDS